MPVEYIQYNNTNLLLRFISLSLGSLHVSNPSNSPLACIDSMSLNHLCQSARCLFHARAPWSYQNPYRLLWFVALSSLVLYVRHIVYLGLEVSVICRNKERRTLLTSDLLRSVCELLHFLSTQYS